MWVYDSQGVSDVLVYDDVPVSMATNSWTPGLLQTGTEYTLAVSVFEAKDPQAGPSLPTKTVWGDTFEYGLLIEYSNDIGFTT
ncbi:MAG: hypothetical protein ACYS9C_17695, partial [Planctomycetota bacterium]